MHWPAKEEATGAWRQTKCIILYSMYSILRVDILPPRKDSIPVLISVFASVSNSGITSRKKPDRVLQRRVA